MVYKNITVVSSMRHFSARGYDNLKYLQQSNRDRSAAAVHRQNNRDTSNENREQQGWDWIIKRSTSGSYIPKQHLDNHWSLWTDKPHMHDFIWSHAASKELLWTRASFIPSNSIEISPKFTASAGRRSRKACDQTQQLTTVSSGKQNVRIHSVACLKHVAGSYTYIDHEGNHCWKLTHWKTSYIE